VARGSQIVFNASKFLRNYALKGGLLSSQEDSVVNFTSCLFQDNLAFLGGVFHIQGYSTVKVDGKSNFTGNLALHHGSIGFMTDQEMYPIEIMGSIFERNGVSAIPKERKLREWLVMRGVQDRWIDRIESIMGKVSLKVRDNYAFHIIQGQLIMFNVTVVQ
jgi:hypothetical protein